MNNKIINNETNINRGENKIKLGIKKALSFVFEIVKIAVIATVIVVPIRYYLFQPFFVRGESMDPTFKNGDYLIIDEITYRFREPVRGEVVVFKFPYDKSQKFIKRVIGLPGETVEIKNGEISIYNQLGIKLLDESEYLPELATAGDMTLNLLEGEYFVLGDNRFFSFDSRRFGPISTNDIIGRAVFRAWPFASFSVFEIPNY